MKTDNRKANPTRYNKSKYTSAQIDAKYEALGRSIVLRLDPEWDVQLTEMNRSKRGRPFKYSDLMMGSIAYLRYTLGKSLRITEGLARAMLWNSETPDHVTIWRRTCAKSVTIQGNKIKIDTKDDKTYVLMADSTGVTTTGKGRWIEFKWDIKCSYIKMHILVEEESQKILAFRLTDIRGGDAQNLPGMLDEALEKLGVPLEDRTAEPSVPAEATGSGPTEEAAVSETGVSVHATSTPAEESSMETITEYVCACGCGETAATERKAARVKKPPVAILKGDGGYDSRDAFSHCRKRGVRTVIRVRIDARTLSDGKDRARSEAVLEQLGGGCTAARFARMGKAERKKRQKEWMAHVKYSGRWNVEIVISAFKRLLGEPVRAVKPLYIQIEIATKIAVYNRTRDIMREAMG